MLVLVYRSKGGAITMLCYPHPMISRIAGNNKKKTEKFKLRNIVLDDVYGNQCTDVQETEMSS